MQVLFTGGSSSIGKAVLDKLVESTDWDIYCLRHRRDIANTRVKTIDGDIQDLDSLLLPDSVDLVVHFAAVTHSADTSAYRAVNLLGTENVVEAARAKGCRRFVYISTRCATPASGAYGESKLAAERHLLSLDWESLLIIRPSEVYGGASGEGIDNFIGFARDLHVVPMLFGDERIRFSPLHVEDFVDQAARMISEIPNGIRVEEMCGPEELSGMELATRLARAFRAVPAPLWWPLVRAGVAVMAPTGASPIRPEQAQRLVCEKTCRVSDSQSLRRFYYP